VLFLLKNNNPYKNCTKATEINCYKNVIKNDSSVTDYSCFLSDFCLCNFFIIGLTMGFSGCFFDIFFFIHIKTQEKNYVFFAP